MLPCYHATMLPCWRHAIRGYTKGGSDAFVFPAIVVPCRLHFLPFGTLINTLNASKAESDSTVLVLKKEPTEDPEKDVDTAADGSGPSSFVKPSPPVTDVAQSSDAYTNPKRRGELKRSQSGHRSVERTFQARLRGVQLYFKPQECDHHSIAGWPS